MDVLQGYVKLITFMPHNAAEFRSGDQSEEFDLAVVNAARASFNKKADVLTQKDISLLSYLAKHGHDSVLRHAYLTFQVKAPLFVARQWFKYRVGSVHTTDSLEATPAIADFISFWGGNGDDGGFDSLEYGRNEASRRYISGQVEHHIPKVWRKAPKNKKQGSGEDFSDSDSEILSQQYAKHLADGMRLYDHFIRVGVAPEQARLLIPGAYGLYTSWQWTASLQTVIHFLKQRLNEDAQVEIQQYAKAVYELTQPIYPHTIKFFLGEI